MRFKECELPGLVRIELEPKHDERGSFVRLFDEQLFRDAGLLASFPQHSLAINTLAGTIRGLHWQSVPASETKVLRCTRGRIFDVLVDVRAGSLTFGRWQAFELTEGSAVSLYVPEGFAHGYQTLTDGCEVEYLISAAYSADASRGVRYDDPDLAIPWPLPVTLVSERDRAWPALSQLSNEDTR